ncbi:DUF2288 domain-containing protein [Pseudomonas sp. ABC1]|uniref:DUF2288 domain-containing protein n=1 Tax=Pseudomonas sp. ABC1 TaxID=2748080 RepID=UPI0015C3B4F4|nr:DUF2288 domain-containing protein [Pseudomonas sp. ABC1]QLF92198.1 DUF2288 domain-containing protein [Pseudomonas sp. ABC1]
MMEEKGVLYAKLLGETAVISWQELQPFFARGALLHVADGVDLVEVALAFAEDDQARVSHWLGSAGVARVEPGKAQDWLSRDPELWAVVVAPWVLVQERG